MKYKIILFLILVGFKSSFAQISEGGIPLTYDRNVSSMFKKNKLKSTSSSVFGLTLPVIDNDSLQAFANAQALDNGHYEGKHYGKIFKTRIDLLNDGEYTELKDGTKIWLLKIQSPTAFGIQLYFEKFHIPDEAKLYIYNEDRTMKLGAFTSNNHRPGFRFGTQPVTGNTVFLEYSEPVGTKRNGIVIIDEIVHIFNDFLYKGPWANDYDNSCLINISCSLGHGWENESRAICLILTKSIDPSTKEISWTSLCTGTLINNNPTFNRRPLILTARHCGIGYRELSLTNEVADWVFMFNHQTVGCNDNGSALSQNISTSSVYGSQPLVQSSENELDYLIVETYATKDQIEEYNVAYAGWESREAEGAASFGTYCIHHIRGDVKKISKDNYYPVSDNQHWNLTFDQGTVSFGSSGAPVFNDDHRIIGIIQGSKNTPPQNACDDPDHDISVPKFSSMYSGSNSLQSLLGISVGYCDTHLGPSNHCYNGVKDYDETGIDCGGSCADCSSQSSDLDLSILTSPLRVSPGSNVTFSASSSNAFGNLYCYWIVNTEEGDLDVMCNANSDLNCHASNSNPTQSFYFGNAGNYRVTLWANDEVGKQGYKNFILNVSDPTNSCVDVDFWNSECKDIRVFAKGSNIQMKDYAFAESCKLPPDYTRLKYHGIKAIKWYYDEILSNSYDFDKSTNHQTWFVGDKVYWPGNNPGCFSLNTAGEHTIKLVAYPGQLISSSFVQASPSSSISKKIYVVDCNGTTNILNGSILNDANGYIIDGTILISPEGAGINVNSGEQLTIDSYNKVILKPNTGGIHFKSGSSVKIVAKDCPDPDCNCTPLKSTRIENNLLENKNILNREVIVYPNPVDNYAVIELGKLYEHVFEIQLVDSSGKIIFNQDCNFEPIVYLNMDGLIHGMYYVKIKYQEGTVVKKLIKN